jgi:hypothetical protein
MADCLQALTVGKVSSNNRTVNLKKVRDRSLRSHFNELDTKEVNVKIILSVEEKTLL